MMGTTRIEGEREAEALFTRMIRDYPTRVVAAGIRHAMKPFITKAKGLNPRFAHRYKVSVFNRKRNIPVIAAGVFGNKRRWGKRK